MIVAGGNYSYCSGTQGGTPGPPFYGLRLTWQESLRAIAAAGAFTDVYEGSFSLPFGSPEFTAEVPARRREMDALGLRPGVLLVATPFAQQPEGEGPGERGWGAGGGGGGGAAAARQALADEQRYRLIVEQAAAMGYRCIVDFGAGEAAGEHERYVALMRAVAPLAAAAGLQISMKPHGANGDDIVAGLLAVHRQIDRPGFGICLDPGNVVFYSDGRRLPTEGLEELAPCVNSLIVKDCVIEPGLRTCVYGSVGKDVLVVPGTGLVDFASIMRTLHGAGFRGPIMVEKQPGDTVEVIGANFIAARRFVDDLLRSASGAAL